jgi:hypothetical protein
LGWEGLGDGGFVSSKKVCRVEAANGDFEAVEGFWVGLIGVLVALFGAVSCQLSVVSCNRAKRAGSAISFLMHL